MFLRSGSFLANKNSSPKETVIVSGIARSGTTWLSNLINIDDEFRFMFEPFHPMFCKEMEPIGYQPYLRSDGEYPEFKSHVDSVLQGTYKNSRVDQYLERDKSYQKRLVKTIFGNLALAWIHKQHPSVPIVYIIRHPFAVALSKLREPNGRWERAEDLLSQPKLLKDYLDPYTSVLQSSEDPFEEHVAVWCAITNVILDQLRGSNVHFVHYENLCHSPHKTMKSIRDFLCLGNRVYTDQELSKPSQTYFEGSKSKMDLHSQTKQWIEVLSSAQVNKGLSLLQQFNVASLYNDYYMPKFTTFLTKSG